MQHLRFKGLEQTAEEYNGDDPNVTSTSSIVASHRRRGKDANEGNYNKRKKVEMLHMTQGSVLPLPIIPISYASQENVDQADIAVAKFIFEAGILLTAVNSMCFQRMAAVGPGYKMPSCHSLRGKLSSRCTNEAGEFCKELRKSWEVNLFESIVQDVGLGNIVHFLSDGPSWYKAAGKVLTDKYRTFFWGSCTNHCIGLMLKQLSEMDEVNVIMAKAKKISQFIYDDEWPLNLLKKITNGRDIIGPSMTQSLAGFLTLKN